jgi:hypothetical protein
VPGIDQNQRTEASIRVGACHPRAAFGSPVLIAPAYERHLGGTLTHARKEALRGHRSGGFPRWLWDTSRRCSRHRHAQFLGLESIPCPEAGSSHGEVEVPKFSKQERADDDHDRAGPDAQYADRAECTLHA